MISVQEVQTDGEMVSPRKSRVTKTVSETVHTTMAYPSTAPAEVPSVTTQTNVADAALEAKLQGTVAEYKMVQCMLTADGKVVCGNCGYNMKVQRRSKQYSEGTTRSVPKHKSQELEVTNGVVHCHQHEETSQELHFHRRV